MDTMNILIEFEEAERKINADSEMSFEEYKILKSHLLQLIQAAEEIGMLDSEPKAVARACMVAALCELWLIQNDPVDSYRIKSRTESLKHLYQKSIEILPEIESFLGDEVKKDFNKLLVTQQEG